MIGDGIVDDVMALQALLDDPLTNVVDLRPYRAILISAPLTLPVTKTVIGAHKQTQILYRQAAAGAAKPAIHVTADDCVLQSLGVDYDAGPGKTSGWCVVGFSGYRCIADDLEINGNSATQSAVITGIDASRGGSIVRNCNIHRVSGQGISIINAINAKVFDNQIMFPGLQGIVSQNIGPYTAGIGGVSIRNNHVDVSNQAVSGAMTGILVRGDPIYLTQGPLVQGNTVIGTHGATNSGNGSISAIWVNAGIFADNNTRDGGIGMSIGGFGNITSRNTVTSPSFYGIEIGGSQSIVAENIIHGGNICWQGIALQGDGGNSDANIYGNIVRGVSVPFFNNGAISNVLAYGNIPTL